MPEQVYEDYICPNCGRLCVDNEHCRTCTENFPLLPHPSDMTPEERAREVATYLIYYVDLDDMAERASLLLNRDLMLEDFFKENIAKTAEEVKTAW